MRRTLIFMFFALAALLWGETVINGSRSILGAWNAGGAASTIPAKVGAALPAACAVGEQFFKSDAVAGQNLHLCTAANTWTPVSAGSGPGAGGNFWDRQSTFEVFEDFVAGNQSQNTPTLGGEGWSFANLSSATAEYRSNSNADFGVFSILSHATNANSGSIVRLVPFHSSSPQTVIPAAFYRTKPWEIRFRFKLGSTSNARVRLGVHDHATALQGSTNRYGVFFRYDTEAAYDDDAKGSGAGRWMVQHCNGNCTANDGMVVDTGIAPDTDWHVFSIKYDAASSTLRLGIDGTERTVCATGCDDAFTSAWTGWSTFSAGGGPNATVGFELGGSGLIHMLDYVGFRMEALRQ